jgi:hypothetical protein
MLCQRARIQGKVQIEATEDCMIAVIVAGMWQALGQAGVFFQRHSGKVRGHVVNRHPEGTAVGEVDQAEGGADTAARAAVASVLLQCQQMNGCTRSVPCVHSMRQTGRTYVAR